MNVTAKKVGIVLMILAAFFAIFLYAYFDPETTPFPKCPFYWAARFPKLYSVSRNPVFSWSMLAIIFLWWILRNCFGW